MFQTKVSIMFDWHHAVTSVSVFFCCCFLRLLLTRESDKSREITLDPIRRSLQSRFWPFQSPTADKTALFGSLNGCFRSVAPSIFVSLQENRVSIEAFGIEAGRRAVQWPFQGPWQDSEGHICLNTFSWNVKRTCFAQRSIVINIEINWSALSGSLLNFH